jgi:hypothetical protein
MKIDSVFLDFIDLVDISLFVQVIFKNANNFKLNSLVFVDKINKLYHKLSLIEIYFDSLTNLGSRMLITVNHLHELNILLYYINKSEPWSKIMNFNIYKVNEKDTIEYNTFPNLLLSYIEYLKIDKTKIFEVNNDFLNINIFLYKLFNQESDNIFIKFLKSIILYSNPNIFDKQFTLISTDIKIILNELKLVYENFNVNDNLANYLPRSITLPESKNTKTIFLNNRLIIKPETGIDTNSGRGTMTQDSAHDLISLIRNFCFQNNNDIYIYLIQIPDANFNFSSMFLYVNNVKYNILNTNDKFIYIVNLKNSISITSCQIKDLSNRFTKNLTPIKVNFNIKNSPISINNLTNNSVSRVIQPTDFNLEHGYNFNNDSNLNGLYIYEYTVDLYTVEYKIVKDFDSYFLIEYNIPNENKNTIKFSMINLYEPPPSIKFSFLNSVINVNYFDEIKSNYLKKFLQINTNPFKLDKPNNFYDKINYANVIAKNQCSFLRLYNLKVNIVDYSESRKMELKNWFNIAEHKENEQYINFKQKDTPLIMNYIKKFEINFKNNFIKSIDLDINFNFSDVLYSINDKKGLCDVQIIDFNLLKIRAVNIFDEIINNINVVEIRKHNNQSNNLIFLKENDDENTNFESTFIILDFIKYSAYKKSIIIEMEFNFPKNNKDTNFKSSFNNNDKDSLQIIFNF